MDGESCLRKKIKIAGVDYYVIVGEHFATIKYAYENRRDNWDDREKLETLCETITELQEVIAYRNHEEETNDN